MSASLNGVEYSDPYTGASGIGRIEDNISISFVGLLLSHRQVILGGKVLLINSFGAGGIFFNNDALIIDFPIDIEGEFVALHGSSGLDFFLSSDVSLGGSVDYTISTIKKFKANGQKLDSDKVNLDRFDLNIGFQYYF